MATSSSVGEGSQLILDCGTVIPIEGSWVPRWTFLRDLIGEMGVTSVNWTHTGVEEVRLWVDLNRRMDKEKVVKIYPVSKMNDTLQFMLPVNGEYLLYCWIDEKLSFDRRKELYWDLGLWIRSVGSPYEYAMITKGGLHNNFYLHYDLVYNRHHTQSTTGVVRDYPPEFMEFLLRSSLNTLTAILHTAWMRERSGKRKTRGKNAEVAWDLIRWDDVLAMAPHAVTYTSWIAITLQQLHSDPTFPMKIYEEEIEEVKETFSLIGFDWLLGTLNTGRDRILTYIMTLTEEEVSDSCQRELAMRHLLAGARNTNYIPDTHLTSVTVKENKKGSVIVQAPNPSLLLSRLVQWTNNTLDLSEALCQGMIEQNCGNYMNTKSKVMTIHRVLPAILMKIAYNGTTNERVIDTSEYDRISRQIYSTLGSEVLHCLLLSVIKSIEVHSQVDTADERMLLSRLELLAEAILAVVENEPHTDFVAWPVIDRGEVEILKKIR